MLEKIEVIDATPVKSGLGLPAARYRELATDVDLVFGCATSNDYEIPYLGMRDDWFGSLLRLDLVRAEMQSPRLRNAGGFVRLPTARSRVCGRRGVL